MGREQSVCSKEYTYKKAGHKCCNLSVCTEKEEYTEYYFSECERAEVSKRKWCGVMSNDKGGFAP